MSDQKNYSGTLNYKGKEVPILDVKGFRRLNSDYKKSFIKVFIDYHEEDFENGMNEIHLDKTISYEDKRNVILESFYFNSIISLVDFVHPFPISKKIAYYFVKYNVLVTNIIYSKTNDELHFNWKRIYKEIQSFDWKEENYFAIK